MSTRQFADLPAADRKEPNTVPSQNTEPSASSTPKKRRSHTTVKIVEMNQPDPRVMASALNDLLKSNAANRAAKAAAKQEAA